MLIDAGDIKLPDDPASKNTQNVGFGNQRESTCPVPPKKVTWVKGLQCGNPKTFKKSFPTVSRCQMRDNWRVNQLFNVIMSKQVTNWQVPSVYWRLVYSAVFSEDILNGGIPSTTPCPTRLETTSDLLLQKQFTAQVQTSGS